jgi:hypothetical protein
MYTPDAMAQEAQRLAEVYSTKSQAFRRVLIDRLCQENPELARMVMLRLIPIVYSEHIHRRMNWAALKSWVRTAAFWLTVGAMWALIVYVWLKRA